MKDFKTFQVGYALVQDNFISNKIIDTSVISWEEVEKKSNDPKYLGYIIVKTTYPYPVYETEKLKDTYGKTSYVEHKYYVIKDIVGKL